MDRRSTSQHIHNRPPFPLYPAPMRHTLSTKKLLKQTAPPYVTFALQRILVRLIQQTEVILNIMQQNSLRISDKSSKITHTKSLAGSMQNYSLKAQMYSVDRKLKRNQISPEVWRELQYYFEKVYSETILPNASSARSIADWVIDPGNKIGSIWHPRDDEAYSQESVQAIAIYFSEADVEISNVCQSSQGLLTTLTQRYNLCLNVDSNICDLLQQLKLQISEGLN